MKLLIIRKSLNLFGLVHIWPTFPKEKQFFFLISSPEKSIPAYQRKMVYRPILKQGALADNFAGLWFWTFPAHIIICRICSSKMQWGCEIKVPEILGTGRLKWGLGRWRRESQEKKGNRNSLTAFFVRLLQSVHYLSNSLRTWKLNHRSSIQ